LLEHRLNTLPDDKDAIVRAGLDEPGAAVKSARTASEQQYHRDA
jgi:hypothetical protein